MTRRTWPELISWGLKELRTTATAFVGIWAILVSTGTIDRIWPVTDAVPITSTAIVREAPPEVVAAAEEAGETAPPLVAVPLDADLELVDIGSALILECVNDDCTETLQTETFQDGSAIVERRIEIPEGLDMLPEAMPTALATDTDIPGRPTMPPATTAGPIATTPPIAAGEVVTVTTLQEPEPDWSFVLFVAGLSVIAAIGLAVIWRRFREWA